MLHVVYRSYGGENRKGRPRYYSKLLALASLIRSFQRLVPGQAELIFVNDGPIPPERLRLMGKSGEIVVGNNLGMKGSMKFALDLPFVRNWPRTDMVWLAEDDYLYLQRALPDLVAASAIFPEAAYFGLYALIGSRLPSGDGFDDIFRVPRTWRDSQPQLVDGHPWRNALSTTSTYGARVGALLDDRAMTRMAARTGGAWDHTTCLMYQGYIPYPWSSLIRSGREVAGARAWVRWAGVTAARLCLDAYQVARLGLRAQRRVLVAPDPALATHLETIYLARGVAWEDVAAETQRWLSAEG